MVGGGCHGTQEGGNLEEIEPGVPDVSALASVGQNYNPYGGWWLPERTLLQSGSDRLEANRGKGRGRRSRQKVSQVR